MKDIKLLWIDDMVDWAASAQKNLELIAPKYEVKLTIIIAENGEDPDIDWKLNMYNFNGIVMDYHMEPHNGDKYIRDIRQQDHLTTIPIIFYSQDTDADLVKLVEGIGNVTTVFRGNLEDKIKEMFFEK